MEREIAETITAVDEEEWNKVAGTHNIERSHKWYRTVEDSGMRTMYYVFLKENGTLTAAACCYPSQVKMYVELPLLEVKSPLGTSQAFFSKTPEHADMLLKGLEEIRKKEKAKGILILELKRGEFTTIKNQVKRFTNFEMRDNTYIDLNFTDLDDYLSSLDGKSRRSVRITLNKARKRWGIKSLVTNDFSTWKKVAYRLQEYTCAYHNDYKWLLTEKFYEALEKNMKENAELLFFFKDDIPLVFVLVLHTPEIVQYRFPGVDPQYKDYQAYFLLYYKGIKRAIEKRQKRIYFGTTTYEFKEKIGCKREELFGLVKMKNPVLDLALKSYVTVSKVQGKKF